MTAVVERVDWELAACFGHDEPDLWFPSEKGPAETVARARKICSRCPILPGCRAYALARNEPHGVWGGLTTAQRRQCGRPAAVCSCGHRRAAHRDAGPCRWCDCGEFSSDGPP